MNKVPYIAAIAICCLTGCLGHHASPNDAGPHAVVFHYEGPGHSVCITGDFNQWKTDTHCMQKKGRIWSIQIPLRHGPAHYAFIVDGQHWVMDPNALYVENDGFGRRNSVVMVE